MIERELQEDCNAYLRTRGIRYFHDQKGRGNNKRTRAGLPDLIIWPGYGHTLFVELKTSIGCLTKEQEAFARWATANHYDYLCLRDFDTFKAHVDKLIEHGKHMV